MEIPFIGRISEKGRASFKGQWADLSELYVLGVKGKDLAQCRALFHQIKCSNIFSQDHRKFFFYRSKALNGNVVS